MRRRRTSIVRRAEAGVEPVSASIPSFTWAHSASVSGATYRISGRRASSALLPTSTRFSISTWVGTFQTPAFFVASTSAGSLDSSRCSPRLRPKNADWSALTGAPFRTIAST